MVKYSRWKQISVWHSNVNDILHIRDQMLKYEDKECVTLRTKNMKHAIFVRSNLEKIRGENKQKEELRKKENSKMLREMI